MAKYYIRGDSNYSDHLPMWGKVLLQVEKRRKSSYVMKSCYLGEAAVKEGIHRIGAAILILALQGNCERWLNFTKSTTSKEPRPRGKGKCPELLQTAVTAFQGDPLNMDLQA
jgi:hypothetical protein